MDNLKKVLCGISAAMLIVTQSLTAVVYGASGLDDPEFDSALAWMHENGLTKYDTVDSYRPFATLTREQAAKFYSEFAQTTLGETPEKTGECQFDDLSKADPSLKESIVDACELGLFHGSNGKFMPKQPLTKAAALTVLVRALDGEKDESVQPWWKNYFLKASELGLTKESNVMELDREVTRYEIGLMLYRASGEDSSTGEEGDELEDLLSGLLGGDDEDTSEDGDSSDEGTSEEGETEEDVTGEDEEDLEQSSDVKGSIVEVMLNPATPAGGAVVSTGTNIEMMKFDLAAGDEDAIINSITVEREGLGSNQMIDQVYVRDESGNVVTNQRGLSSDDTATLIFKGGYAINAGTMETFSLYVDLAGAENKQIQFSIDPANIDADVDVEGETIVSSVFNGVDYTAESFTLKDLEGKATDPTNEITVGDKDTEVGRLSFEVGAENDEDVVLHSMELECSETIDEYLDNLDLRINGSSVNAELVINGDNLIVNFDDGYEIDYGESNTFYLYADVIGGEKDDVIQFKVDNKSDIVAYEKKSKASLSVEYANEDGGEVEKYLEAYKIKEGENLITKSSNSPSSKFIANDTDDIEVLLANANFKSEVYVEKIKVKVTTLTGDGGDIENNKVLDNINFYLDGKRLDKVSASDTVGKGTYEFSVYKNLKGNNKIKITVDTLKDAADGSQVKNVTINQDSFPDAEYIATSNDVTTINGEAQSSTFTIKNSKLSAVTRVDGFSNGDKIVAGVNDYKLGEFSVNSNNVKKLRINGMDVSLLSGESEYSDGYSYITNVKIVVDGETLDTDNLGSKSSFNSLGLEIPVGKSKDFAIYADVSNSYPDGTENLQLQLDINDVDQVDDNGSVSSLDIDKDVYTVAFDVIDGGNLVTEKLSDDTPSVDAVSVSSDSVEIAKFDFKAEDDDITIQQLAFTGTEGAHDLGTQFAVYKDGERKTEWRALAEDSGDYYIDFQLTSEDYMTLTKGEDTTLVVKMKNNTNMDSADKSNKNVNVSMITGGISTAQTKLVSESNSKEIELSKVLGPSKAQYVRRTMINVGSFTADESSASAELSTNNGKSAAVKVLPFQFNIDNISDISDKDIKVSIDKVELAGNEKENVEIGITTGDTLSGVTLEKMGDNPSFNYSTGDTDNMNVYVVFTGDSGNDISAEGTRVKLSYTIDNEDNDDSVKIKIPQLSDSLNNDMAFDKYAINTSDFAEFLSGSNTGTGVNASDKGYGMVWSDKAASSLSAGVYDWFMDKKVNGLDTDYVEIY